MLEDSSRCLAARRGKHRGTAVAVPWARGWCALQETLGPLIHVGWPSERGGRRDVTMGDRLRVYRQKTLPTSREYDLHTPDSQGLPWASLPALRSWRVGGGEGGVVVGGKEAAQRQVRSAQGRRGEGKRHPGGEPGGASDVEKHFLDLAFHG